MADEDFQVNVDIQSQLRQLFDEIKGQRDEMKELKEEVQGNSLNVTNEVKKLRSEKEIKWTHIGNKIQFEFNSGLEDNNSQIQWALEHNKIDYAKELVQEATEKLKKRNKLIRIADSSDAGWKTVRQYEVNPVASDSEDESKIFRAENRAIKKQKLKQRSKTSTVNSGFRNTYRQGSFPLVGSNSMISPRFPALSQSRAPNFRGFNGNFGPRFSGPASYTGPGSCFACGKMSHFRRDCPYISNQRNGITQQIEGKK